MTESPRVLIVFHTSEGQTARIAERIADALRAAGDEVDVRSTDDAPSPKGYDAVVVGDAVRAHHHSKDLTRYVVDHAAALNAMPAALFQVSLTSTNPDETHTAAARKIVDELLERSGFEPALVGMFAGAPAYSKYSWFIRRVMRWISKREGGDTDMTRDYEYTDWEAVERFALDVDALRATRAGRTPGPAPTDGADDR